MMIYALAGMWRPPSAVIQCKDRKRGAAEPCHSLTQSALFSFKEETMFKSRILPAACGALVLLSACGGGTTDNDTGGSAALETKADALRELSLSAGALLELVDGAVDVSGAPGAPARAVSKRLADDGVAAKAARSCSTGTSVEQEVTRNHLLFAGITSSGLRLTDTNCVQTSVGSRQTSAGVTERGDSVTAGNVRYAYLRDGANGLSGTPYIVEYREPAEGTASFIEAEARAGDIEARGQDNVGTELRALYFYSYENSQGDLVRIALGDGVNAPLKIVIGNTLTLTGSYGYRTQDCSGGTVTVSTPQGLTRNGAGDFNGGQLRLASGGRNVQFSFKNDGSATLTRNGVEENVTRNEISQAMNADPCGIDE